MDECNNSITVLSWNVNGFWRKRSTVLSHLKSTTADVIFLQETYLGPKKNLPPGTVISHDLGPAYDWAVFNVYKANSRGVAVLFRRGLCCEGLQVVGDKKGRYIIVTCTVNRQDVVFVNIYNPCDDKIEFESDCDLEINSPKSGFFILGGDFNTVLETELDKTSDIRNRGHKDRRKSLVGFLKKFNLVDVWRYLYPQDLSFTYFGAGEKGKSRLDYLFLPEQILRRVRACKVHVRPQYSEKEGFISDHAPISIQISTGNTQWQFDRCLLRDKHCTTYFLNVMKTFSGRKTKRKAELWTGLKLRVQCEENTYKKRRCEEAKEETGRGRGVTHKEVLIHTEAVSNMQVLQMENFAKTTGQILTRSRDAQHDLQHFLDKLHKTNKSEELQYTLNSFLMEQISKKEILTTIECLSDSHCQTPDGIPVKFYQNFACQLTDYLQAVFNQVLHQKPFNDMFNESIACKHVFPELSIPQTISHDHNYCNTNGAYLIVSVFNVDYIILSSILAQRLNNIMGHLLNPGQSTSNCISVDSCIKAIQKVNSSRTPSIIISLKVHTGGMKWAYLFQRLKDFNLPKRFQILLKALVTKTNSCMDNAHWNSPLRPVDSQTQGLCLGCPLTPVLVRLCVQPLIKSVNDEKRLCGLEVVDRHVKAVSEQDRVLIFLTCTAEALDIFEDILKHFTAKSGLSVNESLSEAFICGTCEPKRWSERLKRFNQSSRGFYYHGYFVSSDCLHKDSETE